MGEFANYWENKVLNHLFGKGNYSPPTIYLALSTAAPADDGSGLAEPSGNGYSRVQTSASDWNQASSGSIDNAEDITFPQASGSWGTITHFALFDSASGGNLLAYGTLSTPIVINEFDAARFEAGDIETGLN